MFSNSKWLIIGALSSLIFLSSCSSNSQPANPKDICSVFQEKDQWYVDAHKVHSSTGVPMHVALAIMYQESAFIGDAKPPMQYFLFIPYGRASSAYGFAQAQDPVWDEYVSERGSFFSDRDDFYDALDFISWYMLKTKKINNIALTDAYNQYLNYHEGWTGYRKKTYMNKDWLKSVAKNVANRAKIYKEQLLKCDLY